jgi:hypothetical protein
LLDGCVTVAVVADAGDEGCVVAEAGAEDGEIGYGSAEPRSAGQDVPEQFTDSDDMRCD